MSDDIRMLGTILNVILLVLCFIRLHTIDLKSPAFVLYLSMTMAWGWLVIGDISYWVDWINFGAMGEVGPGFRLLGFRFLILIGMIYTTLAGPSRSKQ